ncbi:MAG: AbrB/MazE/SpoVT family DNA-binding domain-containing protein [Gammaproteobacteria bacterium]
MRWLAMTVATLSSKSQIVLPAAIRKRLGIQTGDRLLVEAEGDRIVIRKAPTSFTAALESCGDELWRGYAEDLKKERARWD